MKAASEFVASYVLYLMGGLIALVVLFIKTYVQERAKTRALETANKRLVDDAEKIKSRYNKDLEELKKEHQLDISKRKYQYESKKETYIKFFKLLDQFANDNNTKTQQALIPILNEFSRNFLLASDRGDKKAETKATTIMATKIQSLTFDVNQDYIKIKQETNTIKLIASDAILDQIMKLEAAYDRSWSEASQMMNNLTKWMASGNQAKMQEDQQKIQIAGQAILLIRDTIIKLMRQELNEI